MVPLMTNAHRHDAGVTPDPENSPCPPTGEATAGGGTHSIRHATPPPADRSCDWCDAAIPADAPMPPEGEDEHCAECARWGHCAICTGAYEVEFGMEARDGTVLCCNWCRWEYDRRARMDSYPDWDD